MIPVANAAAVVPMMLPDTSVKAVAQTTRLATCVTVAAQTTYPQ